MILTSGAPGKSLSAVAAASYQQMRNAGMPAGGIDQTRLHRW